jgi:hypothetical protein
LFASGPKKRPTLIKVMRKENRFRAIKTILYIKRLKNSNGIASCGKELNNDLSNFKGKKFLISIPMISDEFMF